jgi:exopolysaccharide production protein ExoZ
MTHYRSIHYLRAIAASMVVWFHVHNSVVGMNHLDAQIEGFRHGVDIFFVISGFVMMSSTAGKSMTARDFFIQRCQRVIPLYWLVTIIYLCFKPWNWSSLFASLVFFPVFSESIGWFEPVLPLGWTLNYEMFFYALFGVSLALAPKWRFPFMATIFFALVFVGHCVVTGSVLSFYGAPFVFEFLAGMAIAHFRWSLPAIIVPLAFVSLWLDVPIIFVGFNYAPLLLAGMIVAGAISYESRLPNSKLLALLGDASYAIYLVHLFAIAVVLSVRDPLGLNQASFALLSLVAALVAGLILHLGIERPINRRFKERRYRPLDQSGLMCRLET